MTIEIEMKGEINEIYIFEDCLSVREDREGDIIELYFKPDMNSKKAFNRKAFLIDDIKNIKILKI